MESTTADKEDVLVQFRAADDAILLALVLHYGIPESLIRYVQESGRGGRSGEPCKAIIVLAKNFPSHLEKQDYATQRRMSEYLQQGKYNKQCRRIFLDQYMDNDKMREYCLATEARCDVCRSRQPSSVPDREAISPASEEEEAFSMIDDDSSDYGEDIAIDPDLLDSPTPQQWVSLSLTSPVQGLVLSPRRAPTVATPSTMPLSYYDEPPSSSPGPPPHALRHITSHEPSRRPSYAPSSTPLYTPSRTPIRTPCSTPNLRSSPYTPSRAPMRVPRSTSNLLLEARVRRQLGDRSSQCHLWNAQA